MAFRARVKELIEEAGSEVALERRAGMPTRLALPLFTFTAQ